VVDVVMVEDSMGSPFLCRSENARFWTENICLLKKAEYLCTSISMWDL
jgi:hypothetical protein